MLFKLKKIFGIKVFSANKKNNVQIKAALVIIYLFLLNACTTSENNTSTMATDTTFLQGGPNQQTRSRWIAVEWEELPGWNSNTKSLENVWGVWLENCTRIGVALSKLCPEIRQMTIASDHERRQWLMQRLQPYRIEDLSGQAQGLLTAYYEPILNATRTPRIGFQVPIYRTPADALSTAPKPWYSRKEMDTLAPVASLMQNHVIAYVANPIDALMLQIQGSGRLRFVDGNARKPLVVRMAFSATNRHPYKSVARWLMDQGAIQDGSWASIKAWAARNPQRVQEMLWSNPRVVFFREEPIGNDNVGPKGAQGVPLTPQYSVAVDRQSIPYGTPLWLASSGEVGVMQQIVFAQDTGSAITGAVRADYFAGSGDAAGAWANRVKQPLYLWALWPKE